MPYCTKCGALLEDGVCPNCGDQSVTAATEQVQASEGQAKAAAQNTQPENAEKKGPLASIPRPVGIVWDLLLLIVFVVVEVMMIIGIINPPADDAGSSVLTRIAMYQIVPIGIMLPLFYFVCDRRPLRGFLRPLTRLSLLTQFIVCIIFAIVIFAICIGLDYAGHYF